MHKPVFNMPPITRAAGLARLDRVAADMGAAYAAGRNTDPGPGRDGAVSRLSPYLSRRLLTEDEVIAAVLARHTPAAAGKFVQEVFWRSYFKGWLEQHPSVWQTYVTGLRADLDRVAHDPALAEKLAEAEAGRTGIACFDAWIDELSQTGYLHNHARMWFASIWIFTLRLPWRLGADLFLRQLIDGDAASNTLSWRWVGGLHTPGKNYVARSTNIATYTAGRFVQTPGLAVTPAPLSGDENPPRSALRVPRAPDPTRPSLLLLTEADCQPAPLAPDLAAVGTASLQVTGYRSPRAVAEAVHRADAEALSDTAHHCAAAGGGPVQILADADPGALLRAAQAVGADQIVTSYVPCGWLRDWLDAAAPALDEAGIVLAEVRRPWDAAVWPHASAGYFKVKKAIPEILRGVNRPPAGLPLFD